jgi:asparagine synthase (glutamine-hydrolysing)
MCGIAGKVAETGAVPAALLEAMCEAQRHRGPDSRGIYRGEGVGLGVQRLRVIDLETGDQPIYNEDRSVVVVLNGEIYNFRRLREELQRKGHRFRTEGDTEVIVHLYEEHGERCVERLAGMFAFALWDERRRRLLIARDRVGKKPLHYYHDHAGDGSLRFASELQALIVDGSVPRELDPSSLDEFLAYGYINAPETIWRHVRKLPPGHLLVWEEGEVEVRRWWQLEYAEKISADLPELEGELRAQVSAAVRRRMVADVPLGAFLSGGIDSSIILSEMAFHSSEPVRTFSIGFGQDAYNELPQARMVAERFGTEHTEFTVTPDAVGLLPKLAHHYGEPYADSSAIPSFHLAELTRQHVTVALNGDGGDESFGGYLRYVANAASGWLDAIPRPPRQLLAGLAARMLSAGERRSKSAYARRYLTALGEDGPGRYAAHLGIYDSAARARLLSPDVQAAVDPTRVARMIREPWEAADGPSLLDVILETDVKTYLPGDLLTKVDIATMAYSLEARSPLLDHEVMEFAAALPARYKVRGRQKKWLLRRAYRGQLPDEILDGPKRGFGVPLAGWFRDELRGWTREVLLAPETGGGLLEPTEVRRIVSEHQEGRDDHSAQIWSLLCFESWRREFADGSGGARPTEASASA